MGKNDKKLTGVERMSYLDILSPGHVLDEGAFAGPSHAHHRYSNLLCWSGSIQKPRCSGKYWPSQTLRVSTLMMIRLSAGAGQTFGWDCCRRLGVRCYQQASAVSEIPSRDSNRFEF